MPGEESPLCLTKGRAREILVDPVNQDTKTLEGIRKIRLVRMLAPGPWHEPSYDRNAGLGMRQEVMIAGARRLRPDDRRTFILAKSFDLRFDPHAKALGRRPAAALSRLQAWNDAVVLGRPDLRRRLDLVNLGGATLEGRFHTLTQGVLLRARTGDPARDLTSKG